VLKLLLLCVGLLFIPFATEGHASASSYLQELIDQAVAKKLYEKRYWNLLLHYRKNFLGGYTSEVDDPGFFLSPEGKTNPKEELQATLKKFFSTELVGRSKQTAQCAFVARYNWLQQQLHFVESKLVPQTCERIDQW